ncbi:shikimate kinase [Psychroflexus aestuariivivens]|uniref:shikimate kinase n=1 Tax=Psychroflexus aestuariivivens TaxID=1795040 RepID=UPI000FD830E7|nr:shikimate kinase [Psychroflexus aestuariivivens]
MKIVLLGYMGVGKTSLGRSLAEALSLNFIDLDRYIENKEDASIKDIFKTKGEIYFRKIETQYLNEILEDKSDFVLSLGGGTPVYANNMSQISTTKNLLSIYLKLDLKILTERLFLERQKRPLIAHYNDLNAFEEFVRKHLFERQQFYFQADIVLEISNLNIEESKQKLIQLVKSQNQ